jgi:hypothetical protein
MATANVITADAVLGMLRRLPPRERLGAIAKALPETEQDLAGQIQTLSSLKGLWKNLNFDISAETISTARREMWADFPREDF